MDDGARRTWEDFETREGTDRLDPHSLFRACDLTRLLPLMTAGFSLFDRPARSAAVFLSRAFAQAPPRFVRRRCSLLSLLCVARPLSSHCLNNSHSLDMPFEEVRSPRLFPQARLAR